MLSPPAIRNPRDRGRGSCVSQLRAVVALVAVLAVPNAFAKSSLHTVVVPVANMYSGPSDQKDVVSQAIYGSNVKLLESRGEWSRIQTDDHYRGWTPSRYLRLVLHGSGYATAGRTVQVDRRVAQPLCAPVSGVGGWPSIAGMSHY